LSHFPQFALAPGAEVQWSRGPVRGPRRLDLVFAVNEPDRHP
jgi:hypothetical protein